MPCKSTTPLGCLFVLPDQDTSLLHSEPPLRYICPPTPPVAPPPATCSMMRDDGCLLVPCSFDADRHTDTISFPFPTLLPRLTPAAPRPAASSWQGKRHVAFPTLLRPLGKVHSTFLASLTRLPLACSCAIPGDGTYSILLSLLPLACSCACLELRIRLWLRLQ